MIRPYIATDQNELLHIFQLNTPEYFDPNELVDYRNYLNEHAERYFTIVYNNRIAGGVGYHVNDATKSGQITWILFHPDYAGVGLGTLAVTHCITLFKSYPAIEKLIVTTSQKAYRFFEKFGYQLIKTEKDYWGPGLDLYWMERAL